MVTHILYINIYDYKKWGEACVGVGKGTLGLMSIPEALPQISFYIYMLQLAQVIDSLASGQPSFILNKQWHQKSNPFQMR